MARVVYAKEGLIDLPLFLIYRRATYFQKEKKGSI